MVDMYWAEHSVKMALKKAGRWMTAMLRSALVDILWMLELIKLLEFELLYSVKYVHQFITFSVQTDGNAIFKTVHCNFNISLCQKGLCDPTYLHRPLPLSLPPVG